MTQTITRRLVLGSALALGAAGPAAPTFPEGATLLVAGPEGGPVDSWAGWLAPSLGRALPPGTMLRKDVVGGVDGVTGANQFEARTVPDGGTALLLPGSAAMAWLVGDPRARFDVGQWIPALAGVTPGLLMSRTPIARAPSSRPLRIAASGPAGPELPALLALDLLGIPWVPVFGLVDATADSALSGGEVDAVCLHGRRVAEFAQLLGSVGVVPAFSFGSVDEAGRRQRDPRLPSHAGCERIAGVPGRHAVAQSLAGHRRGLRVGGRLGAAASDARRAGRPVATGLLPGDRFRPGAGTGERRRGAAARGAGGDRKHGGCPGRRGVAAGVAQLAGDAAELPADVTGWGWADLPNRPAIMGVLNVTPDSFSDGGDHLDPGTAIAAGQAMVADGADILDVGGESTRPGGGDLPADEEQARILPVIIGLRDVGVPISVDTRNAATMAAALDAGASIVNDVSGLRHDPAAARLVAARRCPVVLMHMRGSPAMMNGLAAYGDVAAEVAAELAVSLDLAVQAGVGLSQTVLDPGIGFAKNAGHNLALLRDLAPLHALGRPLLVGVSRKRFIGTIGGQAVPRERMAGSLAAGLFALSQGAAMLRVHDVAATAEAVRVWSALAGSANTLQQRRGMRW